MPKIIDVQAAKELAEVMFPDIFFRMAVNRVLENAPGIDLVHCKECIGNGGCSIQIDIGMGEEGYCSFGKRKNR